MILKNISNSVNKLVGIFCICIFIVMLTSTVLQVFTRYVLNSSLSWTEELARFTFIWITMLGASIALKNKSHAAITMIIDHLPIKIRKVIFIITDLLILFFAYLMVFQGIKMGIATSHQYSPAIHIKMTYIYLSVPFAGLIIFLYKLCDLYQNIISKNYNNESGINKL